MEEDGFQKVERKKKNKNQHEKIDENLLMKVLCLEETSSANENYERTLKKMQNIKKELEESDFYKEFKKLINFEVTSLVSYGLGRVTEHHASRHQFALFLSIIELLKLPVEQCHLFDPNFSHVDKLVISSYSLNIISLNEEGKHESTDRTLYFMPHCGRPLLNNLIRTNWRTDLLSNTLIIGNSFKTILFNTSQIDLDTYYPCFSKVEPLLEEIRIKNNYEHDDVFNNLSLHMFPSSKVTSLGSKVLSCPPPQQKDYDANDEIIRATN